jgi:hypothetical protein
MTDAAADLRLAAAAGPAGPCRSVTLGDIAPAAPSHQRTALAVCGIVTAGPVLGAPTLGLRQACPCCAGRGSIPLALDGAALLQAVAKTFGEAAFTVSDLKRRSRIEAGRLRDVLANRNAQAIGQALKRMEGVPVDGMELVRLGMDSSDRVVVWEVKLRV